MNPKELPFLCRLIWGLVNIVYPKMEIIGLENLPQEPSIFVGNHAQVHGPIITEERLPFPHYTWCVAQMMNRSEVAAYAYADFWSKKPKYIRWLYWLASRVIPLPASYILSHGWTIPVYRDSRCIVTFRKTLEQLQAGQHIVIYPEHNVPYNNILWEFEDRFIDVARMYYKRTGKCLNFVPMYLAPKLRKIFLGKPIVFQPDRPIDKERQRIRAELMESITQIAISQPKHRVIPYPNIPKKEYPYNLPLEVYNHAEEI